MPRAMWSGAISFGLVNIPVKLYKATAASLGQAALVSSNPQDLRHAPAPPPLVPQGRRGGALGRGRQGLRVREGQVRRGLRRGARRAVARRGLRDRRHRELRRARRGRSHLLRPRLLHRARQLAQGLRALAPDAGQDRARGGRARALANALAPGAGARARGSPGARDDVLRRRGGRPEGGAGRRPRQGRARRCRSSSRSPSSSSSR